MRPLVFGLILVTLSPLVAQSVPPLLNYQGQLTNASGQPLATGSYDLSFSIYAAPCGTAPCGDVPVWGQQTISVAVVDGVFNVVLSNDIDGDPVSAAFGAANRYVEVAVDGGAPILPRQQVLSAPFAVQSERAHHGVPAGMIIAFGGSSTPAGFLPCDGSAISRTDYADLFAALGTTWGPGDGLTTFNLPDLRGRFLRGADDGAGRDPNAGGRAACAPGGSGSDVGSCQADAFQGHFHFQTWHGVGSDDFNRGMVPGNVSPPALPHGWNDTVRQAVTDGVSGTPRTASETRPVNAGVRYFVKF